MVGGRAPDHGALRRAHFGGAVFIHAHRVDRDEIAIQKAACRQRVHLLRCGAIDTFGHMQGEGRVPRRFERVRHAERIRVGDAHDVDRKIRIEIRLPGIVMDDMRHAGQKVFPGADQKRVAAGQGASARNRVGVSGLDIVRPIVGVRIGRIAQAAIMIAVQMIVRVDEAGPHFTGGCLYNGLEIAIRRDDLSVLDGDGRVLRRDQETHWNRKAATTARPRSFSHCAPRPART